MNSEAACSLQGELFFLFFFFLSFKLISNGSECVCSFCRDPVQPHTYKNSARLRGILASALASANPGRQRCRRAFVWEVKGGQKEVWKQRGTTIRRSGAPRSGTLHSANAKSSIFVCGCHSNAQPKPIKNAKRGRIFEKVFFFFFFFKSHCSEWINNRRSWRNGNDSWRSSRTQICQDCTFHASR